MIRDPRAIFEQLYGAGGSPEQRSQRAKQNSSILDWMMGEMNTLKRSLGEQDQTRIEEYTHNLREIELRIQRIEAQNQSGDVRALPEAPVGVPDDFEEHINYNYFSTI